MSPVPRQASVTATLLRYLGTAAKFRSMYPADHPLVQRARGDLVQVIDLLLRDREAITFQIYEDTFFLDNQMLPEETLRNGALLKACLDRSVGVFSVQRGVADVEIDGFVGLLIQPVQTIQVAGGPAAFLGSQNVGHITVAPPRTAPPSDLEVKVEPQSAYEAGHVVTQELRAQAVRRQPLDMKKARVFLSAAIEVVLENRFSLLGLMSNRDYDESSNYHAVNTSILALLIGTRLGLEHEQLMALGMSALVHDIGKVRLPYTLLNRADKFSEEDQRELDRHPVHGANILRELDGLGRVAAMVAFEHHVHHDGKGYPPMPAKSRPHLFSRIVAVVDAYDTLTCARRGTQRPLRPEQAMKWIGAGLGTMFDPIVGKLFLKMMGLYPVGSLVELGSGALAVVVRPSDQHVDRPVVQAIQDGRLNQVIDLAADTSQWIGHDVDPVDVNIDVSALLSQHAA
ncbi:MAG: HD domain-containing protein [Armatimonadetes bacterium]|nr:HD domain-containing protein [Armatimonadota bacterium]